MMPLGTWTLPSGNACVASFREHGRDTHVHLTWSGSPPSVEWDAADWSVYLLAVRPAVVRLASDRTGRRVTRITDPLSEAPSLSYR
jgi:hypothetical protein